jgi:rhodanese-related sulfurtransferase
MQNGFENVFNLNGGYKTWNEVGYSADS